MKRKIRYIYGWIFVRPRRWFFGNMIRNCYPRWLPRMYRDVVWIEADDSIEDRWKIRLPNIHWWLLYETVFRFCKWLHWDGWRTFCTWGERMLVHKPLTARIIQRIGNTTAGYHISGGECPHCGSPEGDPVYLSEDETETTFRLKETWTVGTENGTDYRFCGTTICPKCGYEEYYEDGSL